MDAEVAPGMRLRAASRYTGAVRLLDYLAMMFINTFGITQPSDAMRRRASWFIFALLVLMTAGVGALGYLFYLVMHR